MPNDPSRAARPRFYASQAKKSPSFHKRSPSTQIGWALLLAGFGGWAVTLAIKLAETAR